MNEIRIVVLLESKGTSGDWSVHFTAARDWNFRPKHKISRTTLKTSSVQSRAYCLMSLRPLQDYPACLALPFYQLSFRSYKRYLRLVFGPRQAMGDSEHVVHTVPVWTQAVWIFDITERASEINLDPSTTHLSTLKR